MAADLRSREKRTMSNLITTIIDFVEKETYTDIFIRPGEHTRLKTPRGWIPLGDLAGGNPSTIDFKMLEDMVSSLSRRRDWLQEMRAHSESFSFMVPLDEKGARLRFKVARCSPRADADSNDRIDFTVNVRKLHSKILTLPATGLPTNVVDMLTPAGGLVVVTGPVCSGKTTTLASMIDHINNSRHANIITLEYLTEYLFPQNKSIITQRTIPTDAPSYLTGIQDALDGQAVDVMMLGEVVDKPTMDAMLRAAESGHLVLATMHSRNAAGAISRIADMFSGDEVRMRQSMLADKLIGVIAQKLLPNKKGDGYVLAYEVLRNTPAVADAIRANNTAKLQSQIEQGKADDMCTLNQCLRKLVSEGRIDEKVALEATYDRNELKHMIN